MFKRLMNKVTAVLAPVAMAFSSPVATAAETVAHTPVASSIAHDADLTRFMRHQEVDRILGDAGARMHQRPGWLGRLLGREDPLAGRQGAEFAKRVEETRAKFSGSWML